MRISLINAFPLDLPGATERSLAFLARGLTDRGHGLTFLLAGQSGGVAQALGSSDLLIVGDLRPGSGELMLAALIAGCDVPIVVCAHGFPFCEIGTRVCGRCPLRRRCPGSDRIAIYRRLHERAARILYLSPLHRSASESFMGAWPDKTLVLPPPALPELDPQPTGKAVAFPNPNDPGERRNLLAFCESRPEQELDVWGPWPPAAELPDNLRLRGPIDAAGRQGALRTARALVLLPERPLPFGQEAWAFERAGRELHVNEQVGLRSWPEAELARRAESAADDWLQAVEEARSASGRIAARPAFRRVAERTLLWCHGLGLGDSINLLPFARALHAASSRGLCWVLPSNHRRLLCDQGGFSSMEHESFDLDSLRQEADLVVEVSVYSERFCSRDIVEERWLQIELARPTRAYALVHENLLALLARAGVAYPPERPRIRLGDEGLERAFARLGEAGLDPDAELVVAVHPGAGAAVKRWPADRFAELGRGLTARGARVVLVSGPGEDDLLERCLEGLDPALVSRAEPIGDLACLLAACHAFVGNDSGLMHLACALDRPCLAIFGPSSELIWGPSWRLGRVVAARSGGRRVGRLDELRTRDVECTLADLLREVAAEPPVRGEQRLQRSPFARRSAPGTWQGKAVQIQIENRRLRQSDRIERVLSQAHRPVSWHALAELAQPDLLAWLLAAELLLPSWAAAEPMRAWLWADESGPDGAGA